MAVNRFDFSDKSVLITGSSRGIGKAAAELFHNAGARVAVNGRTPASVQAAIAAMGGGRRLVAAPGNIATVEGCREVVQSALQGLGSLDILVNSAGVVFTKSIDNTDETVWDATLDINLKGTFFCIREALPFLRKSRGCIVSVASDAGLQGEANMTAYCASKGGVVNLTRALAIELAPNIRVNCICPGFVDTDMVRQEILESPNPERAEAEFKASAPLKRMATPREIAAAIAYLASDDAGFITGTALSIDGGTTAGQLLP